MVWTIKCLQNRYDHLWVEYCAWYRKHYHRMPVKTKSGVDGTEMSMDMDNLPVLWHLYCPHT
eukprot:467792-Rhodomonas_salina.1